MFHVERYLSDLQVFIAFLLTMLNNVNILKKVGQKFAIVGRCYYL